jgi:hypothetical protein
MADFKNISVNLALLNEAEILAHEEGISLEEILNQALQQGLVGLRSAHFFRSRRGSGNVSEALEILRRTGKGNPPIAGDELPADLQSLLAK